ncbi:MAG: hypothetical protein ACRDCB_09065 [Clostridium sp.]
MNLKTKKKIMGIIIAIGVILPLFSSVSASALSITKKGVTEYNGLFKDQAFSWTGADATCQVNAMVVRTSDWGQITSKTEYDGWVQTSQVSYSSTSVMGTHLAKVGSNTVTARSWP